MDSSTSQDDLHKGPGAARKMVRAELMGSHSHGTLCGTSVQIWIRRGRYIARGVYEKQRFGETLGDSIPVATARLRHLLNEIENGSYVRCSEARTRLVGRCQIPRLTLRQLVGEFLAEKRKLRGLGTVNTYKSRLMPVLDFAELSATMKKWPLAMNINRAFVVALRSFLCQRQVTPNGRDGATPRAISATQVINILECIRTVISWAKQADVRKLPVEYANPFAPELVGTPPAKDPLRQDPWPQDVRIRLIGCMDRWQLHQLSLSMILPLRPEEAAGLLISNVDFHQGWLAIGTRLGGADFTKGRQSFKLPFPPELRQVLQVCIGERHEGPLLRSRKTFEKKDKVPIASFAEVEQMFQNRLRQISPGKIQTEQDRKLLFRRLLRDLGGVAPDRLSTEFQKLTKLLGIAGGATFYELRHSVTTGLKNANLPHLDLLYLTSHSTSSILNVYTPVDPVRSMQTYFATIGPLLDAITRRARALG
jgi:integrase